MAPRTLTEALRALPPDRLSRLLRARPDLAEPPPRDLTVLASRATTTASVGRALSRLDVWRAAVAEALAVLPDPAATADLVPLLDQPAAAVAAAVDDLRGLALVWGDDDQLHLVRPVREAFEPFPGGLAPPSPRPLPDSQVDAALARVGPGARTVLDRLLWSPAGSVRNARRPVADGGASPVEELLALELLRPLEADTVILPREVALRLRGGRLRPEPLAPEPPSLTTLGRTRNLALVDRAAAGAAFGLLHDVELVVDGLDRSTLRPLRTGGLAARDLTALARRLEVGVAHAAFLLECAYAARLVTVDPAGLSPTGAYDSWLAADAPQRWRQLARAWRAAPRFFTRSAAPGAHALGPEAEAPAAAGLRDALLTAAAGVPPGTVVDPGQLAAVLAWSRPRLAEPLGAAAVVGWTWPEATWLGLVALDAVSSFAGLLLAEPDPWPPELAELFPTPVETVIIQADLTAVAPGPLAHPVAADLRLLADQESRGAGGVYRFSAGSLRRAYDRGWSAAQLHDWLARHSATGVPQPLAYLVDDVGRQHGSIRVGPAGSVLQVEHAAQAAALLRHPRAGELGLRQVAPQVLVAMVEEPELVALLREVGHAPVVTDAAGHALQPPARLRLPVPAGPAVEEVDRATADRLAAALLDADRHSRFADRQRTAPATEHTLDRLRSATRQARAVRVGYVTADGETVERELSLLDLAAGSVRAVDRASAQVVTIPLARISAVTPVAS